MLPFSKITCVQCRQFAIRSFTSAIASIPSSASNPASTPLLEQAAGLRISHNTARRDSRRSLHTSDTSVDPSSKSSSAPPPPPSSPKTKLSHAAKAKRTSSTLASLLQEQRGYTPPADIPEDVKAEEERLRNSILGLASVGYTKRKKLQIARRKLRELETFRNRRMPAAKKASTIIIKHVEQPQKPKKKSSSSSKSVQEAKTDATPVQPPRGRRKPLSATKGIPVKELSLSKTDSVPAGQSSSGFSSQDSRLPNDSEASVKGCLADCLFTLYYPITCVSPAGDIRVRLQGRSR